jgi:hypothetical protein
MDWISRSGLVESVKRCGKKFRLGRGMISYKDLAIFENSSLNILLA